MQFVLDSDACYGDEPVSGIGGYCHGMFWYFPVPLEDMPFVNIPILEFLGVCFNVLMFSDMITPGADPHRTAGLLRTDALTAALALPRGSQRSHALVFALQEMRDRPEWKKFAPLLMV